MHTPEFLGVGTVGERGQISIPAEARAQCNINPGDKLVFLSMHGRGLVMINADRLDSMFAEIAKQAKNIVKQVKNS